MGVWDKDKSFAKDGPLKERFPAGTKFIMHGAEVKDEEFITSLGTAPMTHIEVSELETPEDILIVSMIGDNFANKIRDPQSGDSLIEDGDFPAIVETAEVPTDQPQDAFIVRFVDTYDKKKAKAYAETQKARQAEQEKSLEDSGL